MCKQYMQQRQQQMDQNRQLVKMKECGLFDNKI